MYRFIPILLLFSFVSIQKTFAQGNCNGPINLDSILVAYYPFNGNPEDQSGNNYDGIVNGATLTTDRFENLDSAYAFDGNDAIDLPNTIEFDSAISIAFWVKKSVENQPQGFIGKWTTSSGTNNSFLLYNGEGGNVDKPQLVLQFTDDSILPLSSMPNKVPINEWHHICMTWSNLDGKYCAYLDGQRVVDKTIASSVGKLINNDVVGYTLKIGNWGNFASTPYTFIGKIDEVLMSGRALNCNEVDSLYYQGCVKYNIIEDEVFDKDTTLYATELIQLKNVMVNPPYELTLQAREILHESTFEVPSSAKLNVINDKGCDRD